MSRPVYLNAFGHKSASGPTLAAACDAIIGQNIRCDTRDITGIQLPYYTLDSTDGEWYDRAQLAIVEVTRELYSSFTIDESTWSAAGLFLGSSSFQVGGVEQAVGAGKKDRSTINDFAQELADWIGIATPPWCFATACTSSLSALDAAATLIRAGVLQHALVLGVELSNELTPAGFAGLGLLSPDACRPLDVERNGLVLGEAVAAVWLSAVPHVAQYGCWRLAGIDARLDSHSPTGPAPDGSVIADAMASAILRAGTSADAIQLVKVQAAGSPGVDLAEASALRCVFGDTAPPLLSLKPYLGHTLGASGIVELSALLGCLGRGIIPATPGFSTPDPELGVVPTAVATFADVRHVLFNLIGFGGSVMSLVLEREA